MRYSGCCKDLNTPEEILAHLVTGEHFGFGLGGGALRGSRQYNDYGGADIFYLRDYSSSFGGSRYITRDVALTLIKAAM